MNGKYITFNKYSYLMNRIAYWLVKIISNSIQDNCMDTLEDRQIMEH